MRAMVLAGVEFHEESTRDINLSGAVRPCRPFQLFMAVRCCSCPAELLGDGKNEL